MGGKTYASRIVKKKGTMDVPFRLMTPEGKPPFYVMEDKVWNGLYRAFEEQEPDKAGGTWRAGGLAGSSDRGSDESRLPALRMTRAQAVECAKWLGGRLPRAEDLDYAAGLTRQEGRDGPAKEERNVAIGRRDQGPQSLDEKTGDISPLEVRDLSGNGWEWTADELMAGGRTMAVLRGQRYTAPAPLTYATLTEWQKPDAAPTQYPDVASPYTGFRVVVDVK
jgi:formylglycine-generating enzyme required for sulfatase activity